jgi:hypothetical protein
LRGRIAAIEFLADCFQLLKLVSAWTGLSAKSSFLASRNYAVTLRDQTA